MAHGIDPYGNNNSYPIQPPYSSSPPPYQTPSPFSSYQGSTHGPSTNYYPQQPQVVQIQAPYGHSNPSHYSGTSVRTHYDCTSSINNPPGAINLIISIALAALCAAAAYYCLAHGFQMYDMAYTGFQAFAGGTLIYMGLVFSVAAIANTLMSCFRPFCMTGSQRNNCTVTTAQVALTVLAPIVALPAALYFGVLVGIGKR